MDVGLEFIHSHGTVNLMIASHNIDSIKVHSNKLRYIIIVLTYLRSTWIIIINVKYAISRMDSLNIPRNSGEVFFGQLLGMCDQVTFPLGQAGYQVYKVTLHYIIY